MEAHRRLPAKAASALESLGYELRLPVTSRARLAHRFVRGGSEVVVSAGVEVVDVVRADHVAPSDDPFVDREWFTGSDCSRIQTLLRALDGDSPLWLTVPSRWRGCGQAALQILNAPDL